MCAVYTHDAVAERLTQVTSFFPPLFSRGLIPIIILKQLEELCGTKIYNLFDYVCGTSTGALLSGLLFVKKSSLPETEKTYRELSMEVFKMNNLFGISQLFLNHAFYDRKLLERIVRYVLQGKKL